MDIACIVIGMDIEAKARRAMGNILAESCPQTPLLEICRITPEIEGASTVHSDTPEDLLAALDDLLEPSGRRFTEQLNRRVTVIRKRAKEVTARAREMRARIKEMRANNPRLFAGQDLRFHRWFFPQSLRTILRALDSIHSFAPFAFFAEDSDSFLIGRVSQ